EEIVVTERGKPVARIIPISRTVGAIPERLKELERSGLIRLGSGKLPRGFWKLPRPDDPKGLVVNALLQEREEGR
ncbi:MAG: type II toxin-antitoxin system prevent-host-death family antitoxin, partial [Deltaproteobacteria bacterium]|nr:type II toxin-antitoxin system prevent-host-death family antitoxin [Deltaproteobacteria bacterium]